MNDLQIGVGLLNASRNSARAVELARKQLQESREATEHAAATAQAARRTAAAEEARLALERQRFDSELGDREARQAQRELERLTKERLANVIVGISEIRKFSERCISGTLNITLGRKIAAAHAMLANVEKDKGMLSELNDMRELRKCRVDLSDFAQDMSSKGLCSADPIRDADGEVDGLILFVAQAKALYSDYIDWGAYIFKNKGLQITVEKWNRFLTELHDLRKTLPARLKKLRRINKTVWWNEDSSPCEELIILVAIKDSELDDSICCTDHDELRSWHQFSCEDGPNIQAVTEHLGKLQSRCEELKQAYEKDRSVWQKAKILASDGNYLKAAKNLKTASNRVIDRSYVETSETINEWLQSVGTFDQRKRLDILGRRLLEPLPLLPSRARIDLDLRKSRLDEERNWVLSQRSTVERYRNTDFGSSVTKLLAEHVCTVDDLANRLKQRAASRSMLLGTATIVFILVAVTSICFFLLKRPPTALQGFAKQSAPSDTDFAEVTPTPPTNNVLISATRVDESTPAKAATVQPIPMKQPDETDQALTLKQDSSIEPASNLYGRDSLELQLKQGVIKLRKGAEFKFVHDNGNGTIRVKPNIALDRIDTNSDYPTASAVEMEIPGGIDVPSSFVSNLVDSNVIGERSPARTITQNVRPDSSQTNFVPLPDTPPQVQIAPIVETPGGEADSSHSSIIYSKQSINLHLKNGIITIRAGAAFETDADTNYMISTVMVNPIWIDKNRTDSNGSYPRTHANEKFNPLIHAEIPAGIEMQGMYFSPDERFRAR